MKCPDQLKVPVWARRPAFDALDDFLWEVAAWDPGAERMPYDVYGAGTDQELAEAARRLLAEHELTEPAMISAVLRLLADADALQPGTIDASLGRPAPEPSGPGSISTRYRARGPALGRDAERSRGERAVTRRGTGVRILCITGPPGAGKTHLACDILASHGLERSGSRLEVCLTAPGPAIGGRPAVRSAYDALHDLLAELGAGDADVPATPEQRRARYAAELSGAEPVILIDGAVDVTQVAALLPPGDGVVVVTSRENMTGLAGAEYLPLRPLEWHGTRLLARDCFPDPVAQPDAAAVTAIHELCGGMPVPTMMVSRWLAGVAQAEGLPPGALAGRLNAARRAGAAPGPGGPAAEEMPAAAAVATVLGVLGDGERAVARALGLLRLPEADTRTVCLATGLGQPQVQAALERLAGLGLVERSGTGPRWSMPTLVAGYVCGWAFTGGSNVGVELDEVLGRIIGRYRWRAANLCDLMAPARLESSPRLGAYAAAAWREDRESLAALLAAAAVSVHPALARGLAAAFLETACLDGEWRETDRYLAPLLRIARDARDSRLEAAVLLRYGRDAIRQGEYPSAATLLDAAAGAADTAGDGPLRAEAEQVRGEIPSADGPPGGAAAQTGPGDLAGAERPAELDVEVPAGPMLFGRRAHPR